jgi:pyruvate dehydrogenase E2 component (dihydrolipoamide acetyltransferase)
VAFEAVGLEGFIAKILTPDGTKDIQVGALVCIVVENKEDVASFANYKVGDSTGSTAPISAEAPVSAPAPPVAAQPAAVASKFPDYEVVTLPGTDRKYFEENLDNP